MYKNTLLTTYNSNGIQLFLDLFNLKIFNLFIEKKQISFTIEDINEICIKKKVNFKSLSYFILSEIVLMFFILQLYTIPYFLLIIVIIIQFLIYYDLFYTPLYEINIIIDSKKYSFCLSDENVFTDFLILKDIFDRKV